jgi:hypothetical protein
MLLLLKTKAGAQWHVTGTSFLSMFELYERM